MHMPRTCQGILRLPDTRFSLPAIRVSVLVLSLCFPTFLLAEASTERERALEARVAELERLVQILIEERAPGAEQPLTREEPAEPPRIHPPQRVLPSVADSGIRFRFGGRIKADFLWSRYSGGSVPPGSPLRDYHIPGLIPVGGQGSTTDFDAHAKASRLSFQFERFFDAEDPMIGFVELDFLTGPTGDERTSNAYSPRLRHAYAQFGGLLAGQAWTTLFNPAALAETLDVIGPLEGMIFVRQPQLRWSHGPWAIALENPETTVTPFGGGSRIVTDTGYVPDLVIRTLFPTEWGQLSAAVIGRQLAIRHPSGTERQVAGGLSISGKLDLGPHDLRWMISGGPGIGRYLGLNAVNDAVLNSRGELTTINAYGGFVSYRHSWSPRWRSNLTISGLVADHDPLLSGPDVTRSARSLHINLIHQLNPAVRYGFEFQVADREVESGERGAMERLQFSTILDF